MLRVFRNIAMLGCAWLLFACGTNTDQPVYPLYSIISPVAPPAITSVRPVAAPTVDNPLRYEFDVSYFVTNREDNFIGYNLYISSSVVPATGVYIGISGKPYLETGIAPSFAHTENEFSTKSGDLKTRRVKYSSPAPSPISFQYCENYYFLMTALVDNGIESNASPQVLVCAATDAALCPKGTTCNP